MIILPWSDIPLTCKVPSGDVVPIPVFADTVKPLGKASVALAICPYTILPSGAVTVCCAEPM